MFNSIRSVLGGLAGLAFSSAAAPHGHYGPAVAKDSRGESQVSWSGSERVGRV